MAELYWMALARDVPFSQYASNNITIAAAGAARYALRYSLFVEQPVWKRSLVPFPSEERGVPLYNIYTET